MSKQLAMLELNASDEFQRRHIGVSAELDLNRMLLTLGYSSVEELIEHAVPQTIRLRQALHLPPACSEADVATEIRELANRNRELTSMIGLGYYDTITPAVIRRNVLENPSWYTAYTPYQPEISQGRLETLLNFQTMIEDLTALPVAGASLLDEATAAAEAMTLMHRALRGARNTMLVDADVLPQTLAVLRTRAEPIGLSLRVLAVADFEFGDDVFGALVQYPGASGQLRALAPVVDAAHEHGALVTVAADLLALTLLQPPGEAGADIAVGSAQRFGVPMGFGGPHAGYMATRSGLERQMPGRLVGVSVDADGNPAYRLALQTREQHIRREKATSNICTAQVLLANMAGLYAAYHGPDGLVAIATRVHRYALILAAGLRENGLELLVDDFFDTVSVRVIGRADEVIAAAVVEGINLRRIDADTIGISADERTRRSHLVSVWSAFGLALKYADIERLDTVVTAVADSELARTSPFLQHPVFTSYHSETAMMRYLKRLADKDYALDRGMIPLGSCTMKLNAVTELEPISLSGFANLHPFAPLGQFEGYRQLFDDLQRWLVDITGYDAVSLQPNAGSQGELAGLLAIRGYHRANGDLHRDVCLIPASAHGTNAASAVMAGMRVVVVKTGGEQGEIDLEDLAAKASEYADVLAAVMLTYPSTHGVFEEHVTTVCDIVHSHGGQVYVDGANLNALVGLAQPGSFGADVSHLNLHKTFCIPHGGGGPGVGPIGVRAHLADFLPNHPLQPSAGPVGAAGPVAAGPWGSAAILPITWAYIRLMGAAGLTHATSAAIVSANYIAARLREHYPVLYCGENGLVAHECILDLREITKQTGVTVDDVAKRLVDYGFHAPTMSFPVAGTLMVEPTESEDLAEIERFIAAMIAIKSEIDRVGSGEWNRDDNPLVHAPHTAASVVGDWPHAYSREVAVFPEGVSAATKYWPPVRRIDGAFGDRNLVCACPPIEEYA